MGNSDIEIIMTDIHIEQKLWRQLVKIGNFLCLQIPLPFDLFRKIDNSAIFIFLHLQYIV